MNHSYPEGEQQTLQTLRCRWHLLLRSRHVRLEYVLYHLWLRQRTARSVMPIRQRFTLLSCHSHLIIILLYLRLFGERIVLWLLHFDRFNFLRTYDYFRVLFWSTCTFAPVVVPWRIVLWLQNRGRSVLRRNPKKNRSLNLLERVILMLFSLFFLFLFSLDNKVLIAN